jgi:RimJ/RimL family protein N-acetyltransferase
MTAPWSYPMTRASAALAASVAAGIPVIQTERLTLRAPELADFTAYGGIACSDRGVHIGGPMSAEEAWDDFCRMTATWLLRGHGVWTVTGREGSEVLGFVLIGFEPGDAEPEIGFLLCAGAEGQGLAAEAVSAARDYAFGALGLPTLVSYIDAANARAIRLAERLGARLERQMEYAPGTVCLVYRHPVQERSA